MQQVQPSLDPKEARKAAGFTSQKALAQAVPCAACTVYTVERARLFPSHRTLRAAYLRALHIEEREGRLVQVLPRKRGRA